MLGSEEARGRLLSGFRMCEACFESIVYDIRVQRSQDLFIKSRDDLEDLVSKTP